MKRLKVGDRVALEPGVPCWSNKACREGRYNLCPDIKFFATPPHHGSLMQVWPMHTGRRPVALLLLPSSDAECLLSACSMSTTQQTFALFFRPTSALRREPCASPCLWASTPAEEETSAQERASPFWERAPLVSPRPRPEYCLLQERVWQQPPLDLTLLVTCRPGCPDGSKGFRRRFGGRDRH